MVNSSRSSALMRVPGRRFLLTIGVLVLAWSCAGCDPSAAGSFGVPLHQARRNRDARKLDSDSLAQQTIDATFLDESLVRYRAFARRMVPGDDLVDHLYFGWITHPADRASLAVALKTLEVLQREAKLREAGSEAMTNDQVRSMILWLDALTRRHWYSAGACAVTAAAGSTETATPLDHDAAVHAPCPPATFAFVDRATFTRQNDRLGDLDLLACTGLDYATIARRDAAASQRTAHAHALGMDVLDAPDETESAPTLRDLVALLQTGGGVTTIADPPNGESWTEFLARRVLAHSVAGDAGFKVVGCVPPMGTSQSIAARMRAAMWISALEGMRFGLIEGWRDLRDGSRTRYPARLHEPAFLESAAYAALELKRFVDVPCQLDGQTDLLIELDESSVDPADENRWSSDLTARLKRLIDAQVSFAFCPPGQEAESIRTVDLRTIEPDALDSLIAEIDARRAKLPGLRFTEPDGKVAADLYIRTSRDGRISAVVNLSDRDRKLRWVARNMPKSRRLQDAITGQLLAADVHFAPGQARLIAVAKRRNRGLTWHRR